MATDETLTSAAEPDASLTSSPEPETSVETQTTAEDSSQPDLAARMQRLEANLAGTRKEWERVKAEKERLESEKQWVDAENLQYRQWWQQQQTAQAPTPAGPSDADLAKEEYDAIIEGNQSKLADVKRRQRELLRQEANRDLQQSLQQLGQMAAVQQATQRYIQEAGVSQDRLEARARQIAVDPKYAMIHQGNPVMIQVLAAGELRAETVAGKAEATESARSTAAAEAFTESTRPNGTQPGKAAPVKKEKMAFTSEDMRIILYDMKRRGMSEEDAKKKYWAAMRPEQKEARLKK